MRNTIYKFYIEGRKGTYSRIIWNDACSYSGLDLFSEL